MTEMFDQITYFAAALWRRRWLTIVVATICAVLGWTAVASMPDVYRSSSRIYVDTSTVLRPLLSGMTVQTDPRSEVEVMQQSLITRPNLQRIARITDLDINAKTPAQMALLIESLQKNIKISSQQSNIFDLSYSASSPQAAKDVVSALTSLFVEQNIGKSRAEFNNAKKFLAKQISDSLSKLNDVTARINETAQKNAVFLGADTSYDVKVASIRNQITQLQTDLDAAKTRQSVLQTEYEKSKSLAGTGHVSSISPIDGQIQDLQAKLAALRLSYTDQYPDVIAMKRRISALEQLKASGQGGTVSPGTTGSVNPVLSQIQIDLIDVKSKIEVIGKQLDQAKDVLANLESHASEIQQNAETLQRLERLKSVYQENYRTLNSRQEEAQLSSDQQAQGDNVIFRVIDPPAIPHAPSGPNRALFATAVLILGIGAGVGAAWLLALTKASYGSIHHLRRDFSDVRVIGNVSLLRTRQRVIFQGTSSTAFAAWSLCLLGIYGWLMLIEHNVGLNRYFSGAFHDISLQALFHQAIGRGHALLSSLLAVVR